MNRSAWKTLALPAAAFTAAAVAMFAASVNGRPVPAPAGPVDGKPALTTTDWEETARASAVTPQVVLPTQAKGSPKAPVIVKQ